MKSSLRQLFLIVAPLVPSRSAGIATIMEETCTPFARLDRRTHSSIVEDEWVGKEKKGLDG